MINTTLFVKCVFLVGLLTTFQVLSACDRQHEETVLDRIHRQESSGSERHERSNRELRDLPPAVRVEPERASPFRTLARTDELERYPCSGCHVSGERVTSNREVNPADRRAHWKQSLSHGSEEDMDCQTCHGSEPEDKLETPNGTPVSFNRPDRVCQTCHGKQVRDWKGGSHGKQYKYWDWSEAPVRYNCTTCHDPHDPSFEQRWPATYPNKPEQSHSE